MGCGSSNTVSVIHFQERGEGQGRDSPTNQPLSKTENKRPTAVPNFESGQDKTHENQILSFHKEDVKTTPAPPRIHENTKIVLSQRQIEISRSKNDGQENIKTIEKYKEEETDLEADVNAVEQKEWTVMDTFWEEKRRLMVDFDRIKTIDQHALKTPPNLRFRSQQLVNYLTKVTQTVLEKYRVIFRWIANNIEYDVGFLNGHGRGDTQPEAVLKNGYAVCSGYSNLYEYLCRMADLECISISGLSKGGHYYPSIDIPNPPRSLPFSHAWNHINIEGRWYPCDATWAAGYTSKDKRLSKFSYCWRDCWFLTEPRAFNATHLPIMDEAGTSTVDIEAQLSDTPYETCHQWNNEPKKNPGFFANCMECVSHKSAMITTTNNFVEIKIKLKFPVDIFTTFNVTNGDESDNVHREYTMHYFQDNLLVVRVRLPRSGNYLLSIYGSLYGVSEEIKTSMDNKLLMYRIIKEGKNKLTPFPCGGTYGPSWKFKFSGFRMSSQVPFIEAKEGKADIEIKCKTGIRPMTSRFFHKNDKSQNENLNGYIYAELCDEKRVVFHLRCPKIGTYVLKIYVKYQGDDQNELGGVFLLSCSGMTETKKFASDTPALWGPNNFMDSLGITVMKSSTIVTDTHGEGVLCVYLPNGLKISQNLFNAKGDKVDHKCLCAETLTNEDGSKRVNLRIRCPKSGYFRLMLYGNHEGTKQNHFTGRWMIVCGTPYCGQLFPGCHGLWGVSNPHFGSLGLEVVSPKSSTIKTKQGRATLVLCCKASDYHSNKFSHSLLVEELSAEHERSSVMAETNHLDNIVEITYHFRLTKKVFYTFKLWGNPKSIKSNSFAGQWMIDCDDPLQEKDLFPENCRPWGAVDGFDQFGLRIQEPKSSTLRAVNGVCSLVIESGRPFDTLQKLTKCGDANSIHKSAVSVIKEDKAGNQVLRLNFNIPQPGYYGYDLWAKTGHAESVYIGKWLIVYEL